MDDFMFWMLSNGGGLSGIITALCAVLFLLFMAISLDEGSIKFSKFNGRQKNVLWTMLAMACTCIIFSIVVCVVDAPVSWFRGLPAVESVVMKTKMSKHERPLTIHQFYDVQHEYRDWVKLNKKEHAEWDAMNDGGA